jgi:hypothetical protein
VFDSTTVDAMAGGGVFRALAARNYNGASRVCAAAIGGSRVSYNLPFFAEFWHFGWRGYSDLTEARHGAGQGEVVRRDQGVRLYPAI